MPNSAIQTLGLAGIEIPFPTSVTLQELELSTVIVIDKDLFEGPIFGLVLGGKAQGLYVACSEDGHSHMMAMTTSFANGKFKDGLRLFGMHRKGDVEAYIADIRGIGKYNGANGHAIVKAINESSLYVGGSIGGDNKFLSINLKPSSDKKLPKLPSISQPLYLPPMICVSILIPLITNWRS
ncbi:hypothetical protein LguiA_001693 [Lonicera macranthoides]